jgi:hypothetical protein
MLVIRLPDISIFSDPGGRVFQEYPTNVRHPVERENGRFPISKGGECRRRDRRAESRFDGDIVALLYKVLDKCK